MRSEGHLRPQIRWSASFDCNEQEMILPQRQGVVPTTISDFVLPTQQKTSCKMAKKRGQAVLLVLKPCPPDLHCPALFPASNHKKKPIYTCQKLKGSAVWVPQEHDDSAAPGQPAFTRHHIGMPARANGIWSRTAKEHFTGERRTGGVAGWYCPVLWQVCPFFRPCGKT